MLFYYNEKSQDYNYFSFTKPHSLGIINFRARGDHKNQEGLGDQSPHAD